MDILIFCIIFYNLVIKKDPKLFKKITESIGKVIGLVIMLSILSSLLPTLLGISFGLLPVAIVAWIIYKAVGGDSSHKNRSGKAHKDNTNYDDYNYVKNNAAKTAKRSKNNATPLTKSVPKRTKIVTKFAGKFGLKLDSRDIEKIVEASYVSYAWEGEIYDMSMDHDVSLQWYQSNTNWLKAYLKAIPDPSISPDFDMQRRIVLDTFDSIFRTMKAKDFYNIEDFIDTVNREYLTDFDDNTFMIAFRFLEDNGRKYELPVKGPIRATSDLESLMNKYDQVDVSGAGHVQEDNQYTRGY